MDTNETKEALWQNAEHCRDLFENMPNGFAYCQMLYKDGQPDDFVYLSVNKSFEKLTGLNAVVGKRVTEVIPDIKEKEPEIIETYGRVSSTGQAERFDIEFTPLNMWLDITVYSPEKGYFVAIFDDITKRKGTEAELLKSKESMGTKMAELENLNQMMTGRELAMIELKKRIKELEDSSINKQ